MMIDINITILLGRHGKSLSGFMGRYSLDLYLFYKIDEVVGEVDGVGLWLGKWGVRVGGVGVGCGVGCERINKCNSSMEEWRVLGADRVLCMMKVHYNDVYNHPYTFITHIIHQIL